MKGRRRKGEKISEFCVTFHNSNRTKRREPLRKGAGSGSKRYERWEFQTPLSPPKTQAYCKRNRGNVGGVFVSTKCLTIRNKSLASFAFCPSYDVTRALSD